MWLAYKQLVGSVIPRLQCHPFDRVVPIPQEVALLPFLLGFPMQ